MTNKSGYLRKVVASLFLIGEHFRWALGKDVSQTDKFLHSAHILHDFFAFPFVSCQYQERSNPPSMNLLPDYRTILELLPLISPLLPTLLILGGLYFALRVYKRHTEAMQFLALTKRYDEIWQEAIDAEGEPARLRLYDPVQPINLSVKVAALRYLNLVCEEQQLYRQKKLSASLWRSVQRETQRTLRSVLFKELWPELAVHFSAYPWFVQYVDGIQSAK